MADDNGSYNDKANNTKNNTNNHNKRHHSELNQNCPNVPSGSDSTPTSARMLIRNNNNNNHFNDLKTVSRMEVLRNLNSFSQIGSSLGPPYGPGGQELLNKSSSTSDNSMVESEIFSQASNIHYKNIAYSGIYSSTGFDILAIMSKIYNRPSPKIELGPIDMGSSFVVVDARKYDFPIIYASQAFENLTGYHSSEIIGRNCRFLQAPDGHVSLGSKRRYTDNTIIHRIKTKIIEGKENQSSLVNYKKNGQPFINLLTIIPIFENTEVLYYVGFQVDLVMQPDSILQKMKGNHSLPLYIDKLKHLDGTYKVNYGMLKLPKYLTAGMDDFFPGTPYSSTYQNAADAYESIVGKPRDEESHRIWNKILIEHTDDMIYALTIKGVFLYVSPSCYSILGFTPEELIGYSISKISHSSDLVPLVRELKEIGSSSGQFCLIHRAKCKDGSMIWIESIGGIYSDNGKGRKCVVLSARVRPVYQLSHEALTACGGIEKNEFWSKLSLDGLYLYVTYSSKRVTGYSPDELIGNSMYSYMREDRTTALTRALHQSRDGVTVRLRHFFKDKKGIFIDLVSNFYPGNSSLNGKPSFILCQTRILSKKTTADSESVTSFSSSSAPSPCTVRAASEYDNAFDFLDTRKNTTWQFELNQLKLENKKLQDEIELLERQIGEKKVPYKADCSNCQERNLGQWNKCPKTNRTLCLSCLRNSKISSGATSSGTGVEPRSYGDTSNETPTNQ